MPRLDSLLLDLRFAWRAIWKAPGITCLIVITLALGVGTNTAIFSVVHALLIEPLPYRDAHELTVIRSNATVGQGALPAAVTYTASPLTGPELGALQERTQSFTDFGAIWASGTVALTEGDPEELRAAFVTTNFFEVLGVQPALGRTFRADDNLDGAPPVVLIGWDLFQRRFGGSTSVVGSRILVNDTPTIVIGVMPRQFRLLFPPDAAVPDDLQAWAPFWRGLEQGPQANRFLRVVGRMRAGVTVERAREDVSGALREFATRREFSVLAMQDAALRDVRGPLLALFAGVGILLAIACVNVAGLLVARAATRRGETAVRLALGAHPMRLLQQSLVEGVLLSILGGIAGFAAGHAGLRLLLAVAPASLRRLEVSGFDSTVIAFTVGMSAAWSALFSLAPMTELLKAEAAYVLRLARAASRPLRYRVRATLLVSQVALSLVLLVGAGLLTRTFVNILRLDLGFSAGRQLTFRVAIPPRHDFNRFAIDLKERLARIPGVTAVGAISHLPFDDMPNWALPYSLDPAANLLEAPFADTRAVAPGSLETLGARVIEGRLFTEDDRDPANPVAVIDDRLARTLWPAGSAVGQQFVTGRAGWPGPGQGPSSRLTVIGVVEHVKLRNLIDDRVPQLFLSWRVAQRNPGAFVVQAPQDTPVLAGQIRAAVADLDPRLAVYDMRPLSDYVETAQATRRFTMQLSAVFAAAAIGLTCVGIYGVLAYSIARRRQEFGVRRALGASTWEIVAGVMREGLALTLGGCVLGVAGSLMTARLLGSQLFGVQAADPTTFITAVAITVIAAALACWIPARAAMRVSPMEALKTE